MSKSSSDAESDETANFIRRPSRRSRDSTALNVASDWRPSKTASHTRSEFDFINRLRQRMLKSVATRRHSDSSLITHHSSLLKGIGDDAAVWRAGSGNEQVITSDLLVEDVDFRRAWMPPRLLGHKALAVSLSDIAAMGARPRWSLLSIGVPRAVWRTRFLDEFYEGFFALADAHGVALIGGDISRTPERIAIDSIVIGEAKRGRAVLRSGARAGDLIFVTGVLGSAAAGVRLLESGARLRPGKTRAGKTPSRKNALAANLKDAASARKDLILRHLCPQPRVDWGALLGEQKLASAMIDLSDGLSSDLAHLCREGGVGARIEAEGLPLDDSLLQSCDGNDDALALALDGGEDYELLFTVRPRKAARVPAILSDVPVSHIGVVTDEPRRVRLVQNGRTRLLKPRGFTHFSRGVE